MNPYDHSQRDKQGDSDILFSRTVKAGKRVYYLDVKCDRRGEYYISMTESKRLKDQGDALHPVFEKHKIFLYREDLEKFVHALGEVADYTRAHSTTPGRPVDFDATTDSDVQGLGDEVKFDVEF